MDSTSDVARDLKTRQLRESSLWVTFSRKENFEHSTRACIDGLHGSMTMSGDGGSSCPTQPEKTQAVELSIHDSEPYIRIGIMQHSMILFVDRGLSFPWKKYFPLAKKSTSGLLDVRVYPGRAG